MPLCGTLRCGCAITGTGGISVDGAGTAVNPFVISEVGFAESELNDLANVVVPTPTVGDALVFDGANWVDRPAIPVFDDAADRTAQLDGGELEGMVTYLKDVGHLQRYDGTDWVAAAGLVEIVTFTADGDFEKADYPWLRAVRVRMVGAGGGGGGARAAAAQQMVSNGGGGGGYSESVIEASDLPAVVSVTVPAGGAGGAAGANNGANGAASSFGSLVIANGGQGGDATGSLAVVISFAARDGGAAGTGDIAVAGQPSIGAYGLSGTQGTSGQGGNSVFGAGGRAQAGGGTTGLPATGFGAGGGGAKDRDNTNRAGGAGAPGVVIVELYA